MYVNEKKRQRTMSESISSVVQLHSSRSSRRCLYVLLKDSGARFSWKSLDVVGMAKGVGARVSYFLTLLLGWEELEEAEGWDIVARAMLADKDSTSETTSSSSLHTAVASANLTDAERFGRFWDIRVSLYYMLGQKVETYSLLSIIRTDDGGYLCCARWHIIEGRAWGD